MKILLGGCGCLLPHMEALPLIKKREGVRLGWRKAHTVLLSDYVIPGANVLVFHVFSDLLVMYLPGSGLSPETVPVEPTTRKGQCPVPANCNRDFLCQEVPM